MMFNLDTASRMRSIACRCGKSEDEDDAPDGMTRAGMKA